MWALIRHKNDVWLNPSYESSFWAHNAKQEGRKFKVKNKKNTDCQKTYEISLVDSWSC